MEYELNEFALTYELRYCLLQRFVKYFPFQQICSSVGQNFFTPVSNQTKQILRYEMCSQHQTLKKKKVSIYLFSYSEKQRNWGPGSCNILWPISMLHSDKKFAKSLHLFCN